MLSVCVPHGPMVVDLTMTGGSNQTKSLVGF